MKDYSKNKEGFKDQIVIAQHALEKLELFSMHQGNLGIDHIQAALEELEKLGDFTEEMELVTSQDLLEKLDYIIEVMNRLDIKS